MVPAIGCMIDFKFLSLDVSNCKCKCNAQYTNYNTHILSQLSWGILLNEILLYNAPYESKTIKS